MSSVFHRRCCLQISCSKTSSFCHDSGTYSISNARSLLSTTTPKALDKNEPIQMMFAYHQICDLSSQESPLILFCDNFHPESFRNIIWYVISHATWGGRKIRINFMQCHCRIKWACHSPFNKTNERGMRLLLAHIYEGIFIKVTHLSGIVEGMLLVEYQHSKHQMQS